MSKLGRMVGAGVLSATIALVGGLSTILIADKMISPDARAELACLAGFTEMAGTGCLDEELEAARAAFERDMAALRADMEAERARLEAERARLERERADLSHFLTDADIQLIQADQNVGGAFIAVAASFRDPGDPSSLVAAICYAARDTGGVDPRLPLARMASDRTLSQTVVSAETLQDFGFDAADLMAAQRLCPWPGAS